MEVFYFVVNVLKMNEDSVYRNEMLHLICQKEVEVAAVVSLFSARVIQL